MLLAVAVSTRGSSSAALLADFRAVLFLALIHVCLSVLWFA